MLKPTIQDGSQVLELPDVVVGWDLVRTNDSKDLLAKPSECFGMLGERVCSEGDETRSLFRRTIVKVF